MSDLGDKDFIINATLGRENELVVDPSDAYSEHAYYGDTYNCYEFQAKMALRVGGKILNAACAFDPARLGEPPINATNLDLQTFEKHTGHDFSKTRNFVHGSVFDMPFDDESFDNVVLGEFMEHCIPARAEEALMECRRVLRPGGHIIMTIPLDGRSRKEQENGTPGPDEYISGVTAYHQTWWSGEMLYDLRKKTKLVEVGRAVLMYIMTCPISGLGLVWKKP